MELFELIWLSMPRTTYLIDFGSGIVGGFSFSCPSKLNTLQKDTSKEQSGNKITRKRTESSGLGFGGGKITRSTTTEGSEL